MARSTFCKFYSYISHSDRTNNLMQNNQEKGTSTFRILPGDKVEHIEDSELTQEELMEHVKIIRLDFVEHLQNFIFRPHQGKTEAKQTAYLHLLTYKVLWSNSKTTDKKEKDKLQSDTQQKPVEPDLLPKETRTTYILLSQPLEVDRQPKSTTSLLLAMRAMLGTVHLVKNRNHSRSTQVRHIKAQHHGLLIEQKTQQQETTFATTSLRVQVQNTEHPEIRVLHLDQHHRDSFRELLRERDLEAETTKIIVKLLKDTIDHTDRHQFGHRKADQESTTETTFRETYEKLANKAAATDQKQTVRERLEKLADAVKRPLTLLNQRTAEYKEERSKLDKKETNFDHSVALHRTADAPERNLLIKNLKEELEAFRTPHSCTTLADFSLLLMNHSHNAETTILLIGSNQEKELAKSRTVKSRNTERKFELDEVYLVRPLTKTLSKFAEELQTDELILQDVISSELADTVKADSAEAFREELELAIPAGKEESLFRQWINHQARREDPETANQPNTDQTEGAPKEPKDKERPTPQEAPKKSSEQADNESPKSEDPKDEETGKVEKTRQTSDGKKDASD